VQNGDRITVDAAACRLSVDVSDDELARRRNAWAAPPPKATNGVLAKYVRLVRSASEGCITD
jgi:dihydroxy-acid dehydratase